MCDHIGLLLRLSMPPNDLPLSRAAEGGVGCSGRLGGRSERENVIGWSSEMSIAYLTPMAQPATGNPIYPLSVLESQKDLTT